MSHRYYCGFCLLLLLCGLWLGGGVYGAPIDTARSYIGVREATGRNDGAEVERFLRHIGLGKGYAWCGAFVCYCLHYGGANNAPRTGWAPSIVSRGGGGRVVGFDSLAGGDVFGIYYKKKGRVGHVGFIDSVPPGVSYVITVEGNTNAGGAREGDGVYRRRRNKRALYIVRRWYQKAEE